MQLGQNGIQKDLGYGGGECAESTPRLLYNSYQGVRARACICVQYNGMANVFVYRGVSASMEYCKVSGCTGR